MAPDQLLEQKQAEKKEVKGYFETTGFDRWNRIYSDSDDVNKVQRNIRIGHQKPWMKCWPGSRRAVNSARRASATRAAVLAA